jgi:hypothetical protein
MELVALLGGKAVTYPINATFIVEKQLSPRKWAVSHTNPPSTQH